MKNIPLHNALVRLFGTVKVANEDGEAAFARPARTAVLNRMRSDGPSKETLPTRIQGGEQYHVCCPFCGDRRFRLYISHAWGRTLVDREGVLTYAGKRAVCHNEDCLALKANFLELDRRIKSELRDEDRTPLRCATAEEGASRQMQLPTSVALDAPDAPVEPRRYLEGRGFDAVELAKGWHVRAGKLWFYPLPAVIFPVYQNNVLKSWQARYPAEDYKDIGKPKYFWPAGTQKSWLLYNLDTARFYPAVVLTEGVLDAIRVGPPGVAMFGKSPSEYQERLLCAYWANGTLLWIPDANDPESGAVAERRTEEWNARKLFAGGAKVVRLEKDDPGATKREELWSLLVQQAPCLSRFAARPSR